MKYNVKALNPDNQFEVTHLSELYKSAYGDRFKLARVSEANYWAVKSSFRFSTLLVYSDSNKLVASVSLRKDRENNKHVQLYMPAIDPAFFFNKLEIVIALSDVMQRLSIRQSWELIYAYKFLQLAEQADFANDLINGEETALWPSSLPVNPASIGISTDALGPVLISTKILKLASSAKLNLFCPESHLNFCSELYKKISVNAIFNSQQAEDKDIFGLATDKRAYERRSHQKAGFSISFIEPSLFNDFAQLKLRLPNQSDYTDYLAINLLDPKTPVFCSELENIGFKLVGLVPFLRNRHSILYCKTDKNLDSVKDIDSVEIASDSLLMLYLRSIYALNRVSKQKINNFNKITKKERRNQTNL